jgi:hypothetical protein
MNFLSSERRDQHQGTCKENPAVYYRQQDRKLILFDYEVNEWDLACAALVILAPFLLGLIYPGSEVNVVIGFVMLYAATFFIGSYFHDNQEAESTHIVGLVAFTFFVVIQVIIVTMISQLYVGFSITTFILWVFIFMDVILLFGLFSNNPYFWGFFALGLVITFTCVILGFIAAWVGGKRR